jgi:hypothetical protein
MSVTIAVMIVLRRVWTAVGVPVMLAGTRSYPAAASSASVPSPSRAAAVRHSSGMSHNRIAAAGSPAAARRKRAGAP